MGLTFILLMLISVNMTVEYESGMDTMVKLGTVLYHYKSKQAKHTSKGVMRSE